MVAVLFLGLAVLLLSACSDEMEVQQSYPFKVENMPVPTRIIKGETAEYDICSRSNDSAPYAYSNLDTFRYQDGKLCSISIKVNWGEGVA